MLSFLRMMSSANCRSSLWGWWLKLRGSTAYLRMVLMLKVLSVKIERVWSCLLASSVMVMAASSARFIVCLSGCDFVFVCVVVWVLGLTMDAPKMRFPVTRDRPCRCVHLGSTPHDTGGCGVGCSGISWVWKGKGPCRLVCCQVGLGLEG